MQDLTKAPEGDLGDPSGTVKTFATYAVAAGMAGAAWSLGQRFIASPVEGAADSAIGTVQQAAGNGNTQAEQNSPWGGI